MLIEYLFLMLMYNYNVTSCEFTFRGSTVAVFTILVEQYQPSLKRDPSYNEVWCTDII